MGDGDSKKTGDAWQQRILRHLQGVATETEARAADPALAAKVLALKCYQQQRFRRSYADLLATPRYAAAAQFFLEELYGPGDFSRRDAQFARVVPTLVKLFPAEVVETVAQLAELHALSELMDSAMAGALPGVDFAAADYARAWQTTASAKQRQQQIELLQAVGHSLDALTRKPLMRQALRLMRSPAAAAGLAELQRFLESGFDTFKAMSGAGEFLRTIGQREQALCEALFEAQSVLTLRQSGPCHPSDSVLGQLP